MAPDVFRWLRRRRATFHLDWLQVEVSALCNASCLYCVQSCYRGQWLGGLMDMETFARLEPSFPDVDLVFLQGWGEPLLHPDFWEMARRVKAAGTKAGFTTNAKLLDDANLERLLESGVDILGISLAGASTATHERFRMGSAFEQVNDALIKLAAMKRERGSDTPNVHVAFMLLRSNWHEIDRVVELAAAWEARQIVVSNLTWVAVQVLEAECILLWPELWPQVIEALERARAKAASRDILLHYYGPSIAEPQAVCTENVLKACVVSYRGDVSPCVMTNLSVSAEAPVSHYFRGDRFEFEPLRFGNVRERPLAQIWASEPAHAFRRAFAQRLAMGTPGLHHLPAPCTHCYKLLEQ